MLRRGIPSRVLVLVGLEGVAILLVIAVAAKVRLGADAPSLFVDRVFLAQAVLVAVVCQSCLYLVDMYDFRVTAESRELLVRWTPSFGPKSGLAKVEPAGSVLVVVVSCELGCRPGPGTRNGPTPVRGDGVQVAASAPRSGVGAERRTWRRSSTPAPGAEAARALMRRGTSTSSHRTRPASDSPTTYAVARHCRSGSSARFPRAPRSANHRGAGRSPQT